MEKRIQYFVVKDITGLLGKQNLGFLDAICCTGQFAYSKFNKNIKTYFDNIEASEDDQGVGSSNQRPIDSFITKIIRMLLSPTSINSWRELIKKTTHPAGFQLFGEVSESDAAVPMSPNTKMVGTSIVQLWDPNKNKITVVSTKKQVTTSVIKTEQLKIERGAGSIGLNI